MGAEEETIAQYIQDVRNLKMSYKNFQGDSILWIAATTDGEKMVFINTNLSRAVNGINVNKKDFIEKAKERYKIDTENMPEA